MTKIISVLQLISIIASDHGEKERGSVKRKATSERQKIGRRKQHSTGIGPLFVDAKFRRLMVELNLYKTKGRNNRPQLREWSYTLSFYWSEMYCHQQEKRRTRVGTNVYLCNTSDYLEIALTFSYNLLCNDWK